MEFSISACCSKETKLCGNQICPEILLSAFVNLTLNGSTRELMIKAQDTYCKYAESRMLTVLWSTLAKLFLYELSICNIIL